MTTENRENLAGLIRQHRNKQTGALIGVYTNREAGFDDGTEEGNPDAEFHPFSTVCETHGEICMHLTIGVASDHAHHPFGWCEECQFVWKHPKLTGAARWVLQRLVRGDPLRRSRSRESATWRNGDRKRVLSSTLFQLVSAGAICYKAPKIGEFYGEPIKSVIDAVELTESGERYARHLEALERK